MKRQTREQVKLKHFRMLQPGEVDHEVDPGQLIQPPAPVWDTPTLTLCACLYDRYVSMGEGGVIPDQAVCDLPRWMFLEYLIGFCDLLLIYLYRRADFPPDYETLPFLTSKPILPLAKLNVNPWDWPLLDQVLGTDIAAQTVRQRETFRGYPFLRSDPPYPSLPPNRRPDSQPLFARARISYSSPPVGPYNRRIVRTTMRTRKENTG